MKKILIVILALSAFFPALAQKREHRSVWMSAFASDWPLKRLNTTSAVEEEKEQCLKALDTLQRNNFTTIYYHVRTMCDAMYDSKYEPWSSYVSNERGKTPLLDPLAYILENAHARGLEVYAWLNPYRYRNHPMSYGEGWGSAGGDKNYENSHPEWLIKYRYTDDSGVDRMWTILNPALEEVKQRIVDVVADILSKYDVDGIVFDDYFYQNGLPASYDDEWYQLYVADAKAEDENAEVMDYLSWRRENVNDMVRRVNAYIKQTKPWVRFGIGPAGVAGKADVAAQYGLTACPGSDYQYDGIASDPLAWLNEGSIDFISPQVYWKIGYKEADYAKIVPWWYTTAKHFNRHCFISQSLSSKATDYSEYYNEISLTRTSDEMDAPGTVYFKWSTLKTPVRVNRKDVYLMPYLRENLFMDHSLTPAVAWVKSECPGAITNLSRDGRSLTWSGFDNMRYTVYAVPKSVDMAQFDKSEQYLCGVSYSPSFEIPQAEPNYPEFGIADADLDNYNYAVAILDRCGHEYAPFFVGTPAKAEEKPTLTYPTAGCTTDALFDFAWEGSSSSYELMVAEDADMEKVVYRKEISGKKVFSEDAYNFKAGVTYYCRVSGRSNNAADAKSDVVPFTVDAFRILSPSADAEEVALQLTIEWQALGEGASYRVVVSENNKFSSSVFDETTTEASVTLPKYLLAANTAYYVRVYSSLEGVADKTSDYVRFVTKKITDPQPVFVTPSADGVTLHSNNVVAVEPCEGLRRVRIMISGSENFPARTSYTGLFSNGVFATPNLSDVRMVSSATLADGQTYYARARFEYINPEGVYTETEWSPVRTFVYSAEEAGVGAMGEDGVYVVGGDDARLVAGEAGLPVTVCALDGKQVLSTVTAANGEASFSMLPDGAYVVTVRVDGALRSFKLAK